MQLIITEKDIYGEKRVLNFGMYKGYTIRDLLIKKGKNFHKYLQWCAANIKNFKECLNEDELLMLETSIPINLYSRRYTESRIPNKTFTLYDLQDIDKLKVTIEYIPKISTDSEKFYIVTIDTKAIKTLFENNEDSIFINKHIRWEILHSSFLRKYTSKMYYNEEELSKYYKHLFIKKPILENLEISDLNKGVYLLKNYKYDSGIGSQYADNGQSATKYLGSWLDASEGCLACGYASDMDMF